MALIKFLKWAPFCFFVLWEYSLIIFQKSSNFDALTIVLDWKNLQWKPLSTGEFCFCHPAVCCLFKEGKTCNAYAFFLRGRGKGGGKQGVLVYRVFSLTWPAYMQIYCNKRKRLHKKRVELPQDWFRTPTWPPFHCFGTPIWPPWRLVKTLFTHSVILVI